MAHPAISGEELQGRRETRDDPRVLESYTQPDIVRKDRRTLEIRQFFLLPRKADEEYTYSYDVFFFFPSSFGVGPHSLGREEFYRQATINMRLHAPTLGLDDLCDLEHPDNPAALLRRQLPRLIGHDTPPASSMAALAQMFGAELGDAVIQRSQELIDAAHGARRPEQRERLTRNVEAFCNEVIAALGTIRRVRAKALAYAAVAPPSLLPALSFAEEYASAVAGERLSKLAEELERTASLRDGSGRTLRMRLIIGQTAEAINQRRQDQGYATPDEHNGQGELFTYRLALLKKELQRALYVDTRAIARDPFYRNSAAMVSAGLAATWATLAQIPLLRSGSAADSLVFIGAAVGAYVLKDRIKEWVRNSLVDYFLRWDHDQHIVGDALSRVGLGAFSGRAQERMTFETEAMLPSEIAEMRSACRTLKGLGAEKEEIVHYHRRVEFEPMGASPVPEGYGVKEVFRLSLADILKRLDDPRDEVTFYERTSGRFRQAQLPRVYHMNVVMVATNEQRGTRLLRSCRVVVNRKQILRIEKVGAREETLAMPTPLKLVR